MADKIILTYEANTSQFNKDIKTATKNVDNLDKATEDVNKTNKETFDTKNIKDYNKELGNTKKETGGLVGNLGKIVPLVGAAFSVGAITQFVTELAAAGREVLKIQKGLNQLGGVNAGNIGELTAQVQALSSTFGETEDDILRAANSLSKTFGIDGAEALEQIERGFLSAANQNNDLLDSLREYSVQLKDAGLGAEQFVNILNQSGQQGIFSDKGVDVIKEFGLRIREQADASKKALNDAFGEKFTKELFDGINKGSITTAQALEKVSKKLATTQIPAKQLQTVVADVFGGPGEDVGLDFLKTLTDITAENKNIVNEADAYTQEQQKQLDLSQKFNEQLNDIRVGALEIVSFLRDALVVAFDLVNEINGINAFREQVKDAKELVGLTEERKKLLKENSALAKESNADFKNSVAQLNEQLKEGVITQEQYNELFKEAIAQNNEQLKTQGAINKEIDQLIAANSKYKTDIEGVIAGYGRTEEAVRIIKDTVGGLAFEEKKRSDELKKQQEAQQKAAEAAQKAAEQREAQIQREIASLKERAEIILAGEEGTVERVENLRDREIKKLKENAAFRRLTAEQSAGIITDIERKAAEEIEKIGKERTDKEKAEQQRIQAAKVENLKIIASSEKATFEDKVKALQFERDFLLNNDQLLAEERINIENQFQQQIDKLRAEELEKEIQKTEAVAEAENQLTQVRLDNAKALVNGLQQFVEANTIAGKGLFLLDKALAVGEIIINLQREISSIAATNAVLGPAGVPLTAAQTTAAKIRAATGIATIVATTIQGFKDGVIDLAGPGTGTSDSITARLSKGESVMTAKETQRYKEELKAMRNNDFEDFILDKYIAPYLNEKMSEIAKLKAGLDMPKSDNKVANGLLKQLVRGQNRATELGMDTISKLNGSKRRSFY